MTVKLDPYLVFGGRAREAMEFYQSVLGGKLEVMTFGDMGETGPVPPPEAVMHSALVSDRGLRVMASDGAPGDELVRGNDFAVAINGEAEDEDEIRRCWEAFAAAGEVDVPFEKQMWGDWFGQVTDAYGIAWMFSLDSGEAPPAG
jgi:PhnB protein